MTPSRLAVAMVMVAAYAAVIVFGWFVLDTFCPNWPYRYLALAVFAAGVGWFFWERAR